MKLALATIVLLLGLVSAAAASESPVTVAEFDALQGELPEGVAVDRRGDLYVTLGPPFFVPGGYGEVRRIGLDGGSESLVVFPNGPAPAGVVTSRSGSVYFAVPDPTQASVGLYEISGDGVQRIAGTEAMVVPNGLAIGKRGLLYASDSVLGEIWRVDSSHGVAEPWLTHELLAGCGEVGANGVAFWKGDLFVANSDRGALVRIPVHSNGTPGEPSIVAGDADCDPADELWSIDGIAFDVHGDVYAALVLQNKLVRIDPSDGVSEVLLTETDGLWNPASVAFGTGRSDRKSLYITNYAVLPPEPANSLGPAVVRLSVGVPGNQLP